MKTFNQKIIVSGIALLLFGVILMPLSPLSYISGGLGLLLVLLGCFSKEEENKEDNHDIKH